MRNKFAALIVIAIFSMTMVTGCGSSSPKRDTGVVAGAVVGGLLGSQFGKGRGRTAATIVGALAGAWIGGSIGKTMDDQDRYAANNTLETYPDNQANTWTNPNTGNTYEVTPTNTYDTASGPCRDYTTKAYIDGKEETVYGKACRQPDGSWQAAN